MIFLLLGLAALGGFAAYELSPKTHAWVNEHVQALQGAFAAHRSADAHLASAPVAPNPNISAQLLLAAIAANRVAAIATAAAAKTARTPEQRSDAAQSAAVVSERELKIADAIAKLGVGECGVRSYAGVTAKGRDALLARLHSEGMTVTGNNPWDIDTGIAGVLLRAVWDPTTLNLKLIVTAGTGTFVTCDLIWSRIEPKVREIMGMVS